ncbi:hypothetical protein [Ramlibacter sp.]|uniref:hypothetical protein n=1 Tax=Ramlibacter sp. TaxID=1917967 RepID=UPI002CDF1A47|nr:hypothetical protein [Ramlibacter sp.]HWI83568.1 hypothetical protein [Ramlibacter sp.]
MTKTLSWTRVDAGPPASAVLLHLLARVLQTASDALTRLATRLSAADDVLALPPGSVEFHPLHREAGAPEGALYVDGVLVGVIPGVHRL